MSKSETPKSTTTWRPDKDLAAWMVGRSERSLSPGGLSARTRTEMLLWRATLEAELAQQRWTLPQLGLIADVCNSPVVPDAIGLSVGLVAGEVIDATRLDPGAYGAKWQVDEDAVIGRLARLGPAADLALMDAIARWWATGGEHTVDGWAQVGVRIETQ